MPRQQHQIIDAFLLSQIRFTEIVNRKGGKISKPISDYGDQCLMYAQIAHRASYVPEGERKQLMIRWNIYSISATGGVQLSDAVRFAALRYQSDRGDGPPPAQHVMSSQSVQVSKPGIEIWTCWLDIEVIRCHIRF